MSVRRVAAALSALAAVLLGLPVDCRANSEAWPQRPVRIIMSQPGGTGADLTTRLFAERLAVRWGQPVVVENRPGGDGMVGVISFASLRDDHTLLASVSAPFSVQPVIQDKLAYDPDRDAVPISMTSDIALAIAATESLNIGTLDDLVKYIRANPRQLNWSAGPGLPRYVFAAYAAGARLEASHVPYRELAPALQDLGAGRLHALVHGLSILNPQAQAGKARLLAVTNRGRAMAAPDVPTVAEAGYPDLAMDGFGGLFGWRDMPRELRGRIAADIQAVGADPAIAARLAQTGQALRTSTPDEFAGALAAQRDRIARIVQTIGKPAQ
jgi:tripartite-type tricarboxylate transporter receptor subunit TctC